MPRPVTLKSPDAHIVAVQRTCNSIAIDPSFNSELRARLVELLTTAIELISQEQLLRVKEEASKEKVTEALKETQEG